MVNKSPFNIQLVDYFSSFMPENCCVKAISVYPMSSSRSQWGETPTKYVGVVQDFPEKFIPFLNEENPNIIIYSGYQTKGFKEAKSWALRHHKDIFLNCSEKLWAYNINWFLVLAKYIRFRHITRGINGAFAVSNRGMKLYQHYLDVPVLMVPYCFDMERLRSFDIKPYDGKSLVFLISGRLEPFRDPITSIRVFKELRERVPSVNMQLIISGKGSQYQSILQLLKELNIENCTTWKNEFNNWSEIHEIYKSAHILLSLQEYGGWGLIIPEAMAAGLCVVASSEIDSADTYIIDKFNGLYINKKDAKTMISSLEEIIRDPDHLNEIRRNARLSMKYADVQTYAKKLASFIMNYKSNDVL